MADRVLEQDRRSGTALVGFVALQVAYLVLNVGVMSEPVADGPIGEWRALVQEHAGLIRWHLMMALTAFVFLFLPGALGLRRRLRRSAPAGSLWPDLVLAGALLVMISVFVSTVLYAVLGIVPAAELSDSVLRAVVLANFYAIFGSGSFAVACFLGAASAAMLESDGGPRWLGWWGMATAAASLVGVLSLTSLSFDGVLFGLASLARLSFLAWVVATGLWMRAKGRRPASQPASQVEPALTGTAAGGGTP